jgi:hypothetical protein
MVESKLYWLLCSAQRTQFPGTNNPRERTIRRTDKMVVGPPPLQMGQQVWGLLRSCPGAASKGGDAHLGRSDSPAQ